MCFLNFFYLKKKLQINQYFFLYISIKNNIYLFIIYFFGFFSILFLLWNPPPSLIWLLRKSEFSFSKLLSLSLPTNSFFSFLFRESSFALPICACVSVDPALILSNSHTRCVLRPFNFFFSWFILRSVTSIFDSSCCFRCLRFVAATQTQMQLELRFVFSFAIGLFHKRLKNGKWR